MRFINDVVLIIGWLSVVCLTMLTMLAAWAHHLHRKGKM